MAVTQGESKVVAYKTFKFGLWGRLSILTVFKSPTTHFGCLNLWVGVVGCSGLGCRGRGLPVVLELTRPTDFKAI